MVLFSLKKQKRLGKSSPENVLGEGHSVLRSELLGLGRGLSDESILISIWMVITGRVHRDTSLELYIKAVCLLLYGS